MTKPIKITLMLPHLLTKSPSWEANSHIANQGTFCLSWNLKVHHHLHKSFQEQCFYHTLISSHLRVLSETTKFFIQFTALPTAMQVQLPHCAFPCNSSTDLHSNLLAWSTGFSFQLPCFDSRNMISRPNWFKLILMHCKIFPQSPKIGKLLLYFLHSWMVWIQIHVRCTPLGMGCSVPACNHDHYKVSIYPHSKYNLVTHFSGMQWIPSPSDGHGCSSPAPESQLNHSILQPPPGYQLSSQMLLQSHFHLQIGTVRTCATHFSVKNTWHATQSQGFKIVEMGVKFCKLEFNS